jgi:hypothetical protein
MRRRFFVSYKDHTIAFDINNYLTIEALENNLVVKFNSAGCEYCVDGDGNWKSLTSNTNTESINKGQTLSFKRNMNPGPAGVGTFTISKKCNLKGNCMSMLFGDNAANNHSLSGKNYAFSQLFYDCSNIVTVSNNFLPATTLANGCYQNMFSGCSSLTTAPVLPATTLEYNCYQYMFSGCSSLTTAPVLPATTLVSNCYGYMFFGCSKLNYIKMLATDISATDCLINWVYDVASTGTFVKNPNMTGSSAGSGWIPRGWTVVNDEESGGNLIIFTVNSTEYQAEEGMTWEEWINSSYYDQNLNITIKTGGQLYIDGDPILRNSLQGVLAQYTTTEIIVNGTYNSM